MKVAIIFLSCLFVYVACEQCTNSITDCKGTTCSTNTTLHCVDSLCTCLSHPTGQNCVSKDDCSSAGDNHHHYHCRGDGITPVVFHCVDGRCRCIH